MKSAKAMDDARKGREWAAVVDTLPHVEPWLVVRWVFAQQYNAHDPWPCQEGTKERSRALCARIVATLGGELTAPPPPGLRHDPRWARFLEAMRPLESDRAVMVLRKVVDEHAATLDARGRLALLELAHSLHLNMTDMRVQQAQNARGWVPGEGYPDKPARRGRSRR